jgi:hypothetical protein
MIYYTLTGRVSPVPLGANTVVPPSRTDYPHMGAVVAKSAHARRDVPGYVAIPEVRVRMQAMPVSGGGRAGFLGPAFDPLAINDDPTRPLPGLGLPADVPPERFEQRQGLLATLDGYERPRSRMAEEHEAFRRAAARLVRGTARRNVFDLDSEPAAVRERYGLHRFGQSLLLARRLSEAGVSMTAIHFNYMSKCDGWDTHAKNFECLKGELLPLLDQGLRRRRSAPTPAATTGGTASPPCSLAAGCAAAGSSAPPTRRRPTLAICRSTQRTCRPVSIMPWGSTRTAKCATSSAARCP